MIRVLNMSDYPIKLPCDECGVGDLTVNTSIRISRRDHRSFVVGTAAGRSGLVGFHDEYLCNRCVKELATALLERLPS